MAPYEALYGRRCRTQVRWSDLCEKKVIGVELIQEIENMVKVIRDRLKMASDKQKSYADLKRRDIEFSSFLRVYPWKKVLRLGKKGKLSPRFIGTYEVTERVGPVAYRLALPVELQKIHDVFHMSMLKRYRSDPSHILSPEEIELQSDLTYEEEPVKILAHEGTTFESEETMRLQYPHLFSGERVVTTRKSGVSKNILPGLRFRESSL
ncbi:reverse transcriptase [Gossypium australe]|uniref:Reverse transcriptase n=1 Tax=Gossypium australe TaxID=47621 RepID=A0A5B6WE83_9ROSI|nr:reverse transcriptase [Gossypium australe]